MNRTYLTRAIRELAGVYGYTIHTDTDDRTPREIVLLPAAWLPPIRLKEVEGRLHGRATYSVELRLLHPGAKLSSERRNEVWSQTELQLFDLFTQLSTDPKVIAVENLTVQPGSGAYTPHGEISQTAKADVIICFRHPDTPHSSHRPFRCRLRIFRKNEGHDSAHSPDTGDRTVSRTAHNHPLPNPFSHDIHLSAGDVFLRIRPARLHVLQRGGNGTVSGNTQHQGRLQDRLQTVLQHPDRHPEHRPDGPEKHSLRPLVRHDRILQFGKPERFGATGRRNHLLRSPDLRHGTRLRETVPDSDDDAFAPHHAYGESDEITCCIPGQHTVTVTSDITAEALTYNAIGGEELTLFRLNTRSFLPSVGTITVRIATAGQTVAEIGYTVVPKCNEGCRIAWRSRAGSIEHYTFPVVKSVVQKIRKEQVLTDDAGYEDISIRDERTTTLASAFEPAAVIEALAEIAASPQVWKIDGDKYEEVDILTREQTIGRHGSLGCIEISLRPRQETRCL